MYVAPKYETKEVQRWDKKKGEFVKKKEKKQIGGSKGTKPVQVLVEDVYWKRVIFDEFHQLAEMTNKATANGGVKEAAAALQALQEFRAAFKWGVTATPNLTNV